MPLNLLPINCEYGCETFTVLTVVSCLLQTNVMAILWVIIQCKEKYSINVYVIHIQMFKKKKARTIIKIFITM